MNYSFKDTKAIFLSTEKMYDKFGERYTWVMEFDDNHASCIYLNTDYEEKHKHVFDLC